MVMALNTEKRMELLLISAFGLLNTITQKGFKFYAGIAIGEKVRDNFAPINEKLYSLQGYLGHFNKAIKIKDKEQNF